LGSPKFTPRRGYLAAKRIEKGTFAEKFLLDCPDLTHVSGIMGVSSGKELTQGSRNNGSLESNQDRSQSDPQEYDPVLPLGCSGGPVDLLAMDEALDMEVLELTRVRGGAWTE